MKRKTLISVIVSVVVVGLVILSSIFVLPKFFAKTDGYVTIVVVDDQEEEIFNKKIGYQVGESFTDILDKKLTIEYQSYGDGLFIVSINEKKQVDNYYWVYTRNGEMTTTGVSSQQFTDGDIFLFELKNFG